MKTLTDKSMGIYVYPTTKVDKNLLQFYMCHISNVFKRKNIKSEEVKSISFWYDIFFQDPYFCKYNHTVKITVILRTGKKIIIFEDFYKKRIAHFIRREREYKQKFEERRKKRF